MNDENAAPAAPPAPAEQQQQPVMPLFPSEGGTYTRCPVTGNLTKLEE